MSALAMTSEATAGAAPVRVLYIDDDAALARLVSKNFRRAGWDVVWEPDGEAGLARLLTERFDAVALDHFMPGRDGIDVLGDILSREGAPPVVYCTGSEEGRLAVAALKAGAADYVIKDVSGGFVSFLMAAIEQALQTEQLRRQKEAAEAEVRAARDRAEALLREVDHRIGNSLQMISSFVALQARSNDDEACKTALHETQRRIEAVAQVHKRLYTSDDVRSVDVAAYLEGLIDQARGSMGQDGDGPALLLEAEPLTLPPDLTVAVGVIVTELVTNAAKYAFVGREPGTISVSLALSDGGFTVRVADDGVGWDGKQMAKGTGFGRRIIEAMARTLKAEVTVGSGATGFETVVTAPLPEASA